MTDGARLTQRLGNPVPIQLRSLQTRQLPQASSSRYASICYDDFICGIASTMCWPLF